jgi:hypothetical protein
MLTGNKDAPTFGFMLLPRNDCNPLPHGFLVIFRLIWPAAVQVFCPVALNIFVKPAIYFGSIRYQEPANENNLFFC